MPEVVDKAERNIKDHLDTTRNTLSGEATIIKTAVKDVLALKPVQGVVQLITDSVDNVGNGIKKQAEITRRWVG